MSRTFTKLFSSITESTVWCEPDRTRLMWICMLAMADRNGRVWGSVPGLANRARVPLPDARTAIETFLSPDPDSRTPDFEGRRVEAIDGGWRLLNHEKYRAIRDEETTKESKRNSINARRARERAEREGVENVEQSRPKSNAVALSRDNAEAEAEADTEEKDIVAAPLVASSDPKHPDCPFQELLASYHANCPSMARVRVFTNTRMKHARARWQQVSIKEGWSKDETLDWFCWYFMRAESSDFLAGRVTAGRAWRADFAWLMNSENFAKVIEGNYQKERA